MSPIKIPIQEMLANYGKTFKLMNQVKIKQKQDIFLLKFIKLKLMYIISLSKRKLSYLKICSDILKDFDK